MSLINMVIKDIQRTITGAFAYVYEYRKIFAKALLIPITVLVTLESIPFQGGLSVQILLHAVMPFFIYIIMAITTHRIILLGPESVSEWGLYVPKQRELYFFMTSIGVGLMFVPLGFFSIIPYVGWLITMTVSCYLLARLSLVFPAIATAQDWTLSESWKVTKNHQVHMLSVVAIFPFVIGIPEMLLNHVPYMNVFTNLLSAFTTVFVVAALSVAFQIITSKLNEVDTAI